MRVGKCQPGFRVLDNERSDLRRGTGIRSHAIEVHDEDGQRRNVFIDMR